jgi:hypothetical protein
MEIAGVKLTMPCDNNGIAVCDRRYCWKCNGTGKMLTPDGQTLVSFIKIYGDFAEKEHYHEIR